jgi:hypothetical protein
MKDATHLAFAFRNVKREAGPSFLTPLLQPRVVPRIAAHSYLKGTASWRLRMTVEAADGVQRSCPFGLLIASSASAGLVILGHALQAVLHAYDLHSLDRTEHHAMGQRVWCLAPNSPCGLKAGSPQSPRRYSAAPTRYQASSRLATSRQ